MQKVALMEEGRREGMKGEKVSLRWKAGFRLHTWTAGAMEGSRELKQTRTQALNESLTKGTSGRKRHKGEKAGPSRRKAGQKERIEEIKLGMR